MKKFLFAVAISCGLSAITANDLLSAPPEEGVCIEEFLGCDLMRVRLTDQGHHECYQYCYYTHYCSDGYSFSFREREIIDCGGQIAGVYGFDD